MITEAELLDAHIFKDFLAEDLARIVPRLAEKEVPADETIICRGDPGYSLFIILSGTVVVTLTNDEGIEYTINTQTRGDNFGEMALMTGEPRSANVRAASDVRLAELSQEAFYELISEYPRLGDCFLRQMAQRRGKSMARARFADLERAEIIANLFAQQPPAVDRFLGGTKWIDDLNASIGRLASVETNVLIIGERGTGKDLAARLIHFQDSAKSGPLFHLDCANPPPIHRDSGRNSAAEKDELHLALAQETALFGHGADAGSYARGVRKGYLELADGGSVVLENIDALSARVQQMLIQYLGSGTFVRTGEAQKISSKIRLIATASRTLQELKTGGALDPELLALASGELLPMKPLRERKKDIPVIAEYLVAQYNKKFSRNVKGFSKEAIACLVDHDWPMNVDEMHQVLERAVVIADGDLITERQVFLNPPVFSTTGKFNLLKIGKLRELANHRLLPSGLRLVTVPFILGLIALTLLGPLHRNPANLIVWAIWWPFLVFSVLISARSWCAFCPMPVISEGVNSFRSKFFTVPAVLAKHGVWIGIVGFALILLAEHATHMFTEARATSILLLSILGGTSVTNMLFGNRTWCKNFCPLGRMVGSASALSIVTLGSNSNVCSSQCQTHDCIKEGNCPMGIHPSAAAVSKNCVLCLSCVKKCSHQSVRIDMRFPWYEFVAEEKRNVTEAFFAVTLTAMVLAVKLPSWGPAAGFIRRHSWGGETVVDATLSALIGLLFVSFVYGVSILLSGKSWKRNFIVSGSAYIFLAFGGLFNVYLHELVYHGHNFLPWIVEMTGFGTDIPRDWITPQLGTLKAVVPLVTIGSATASFVLLGKMCSKYSIPSVVRRAHQGILLVATLVFLVIL